MQITVRAFNRLISRGYLTKGTATSQEGDSPIDHYKNKEIRNRKAGKKNKTKQV